MDIDTDFRHAAVYTPSCTKAGRNGHPAGNLSMGSLRYQPTVFVMLLVPFLIRRCLLRKGSFMMGNALS